MMLVRQSEAACVKAHTTNKHGSATSGALDRLAYRPPSNTPINHYQPRSPTLCSIDQPYSKVRTVDIAFNALLIKNIIKQPRAILLMLIHPLKHLGYDSGAY